MADDKDKPNIPAPAPGARAPVGAGLQSPADRGAKATDDKTAEENRQAAERAAEANAPVRLTADQIATPSTLTGHRQMWIIVGPYRGSVLTMPDAEAEAAKDDHWAIEMADILPPFDANAPAKHDHEVTDEERAGAVEAANAWAANVNKPPEPPPEGGDGGVTGRRAIEPGAAGTYETRTAAPRPPTAPKK